MDKTTYQEGAQMMGFPFTAVHFQGKLYAETLEGRIYVKAKEAVLTALDPMGNEIGRIEGKKRQKKEYVFFCQAIFQVFNII